MRERERVPNSFKISQATTDFILKDLAQEYKASQSLSIPAVEDTESCLFVFLETLLVELILFENSFLYK